MTEAEWLACADPVPLLAFIRGKASDRKTRLFACACCRQVFYLLEDKQSRENIEITERYADDNRLMTELEAAAEQARGAANCVHEEGFFVNKEHPISAAIWATRRLVVDLNPVAVAEIVASSAGEQASRPVYQEAYQDAREGGEEAHLDVSDLFHIRAMTASRAAAAREKIAQAALARDVFGNPFRPVALDPGWPAPTAVALARQMYETRDFSPMPILADALQDAGCESADVLDHCRGLGPHVRGCWVIDLVLGKR